MATNPPQDLATDKPAQEQDEKAEPKNKKQPQQPVEDPRTFMDAELFKTESEIRDAGLSIDLPYEAGSPDPKKIVYADADDEQYEVPEMVIKDWDLNFDDREVGPVKDPAADEMDMAEIQVKPYMRNGRLVRGYRRKVDPKKMLWRSAEECASILDNGGDSRTGYMSQVEGGGYRFSPERTALHDQIVNGFLSRSRPVQDGPAEVIFTAGGPASGKSTIITKLEELGVRPLPDDYVDINADLVKEQLPEYETMLKGGDDRAAFFVHEESSDIAARLRFESLETNRNVLVDQVGNNADGEFARKIKASRGPNTDVRVIYADVPVDEAIRRSDERAKKTGRVVPHDLIRNKHKGVVRNFLEVAQMDGVSIELFDTESSPPVLIAEKEANSPLRIINRDLFDRFMDKGGVQWPK